jgi:hypothetical protein
VDAIERLQKQWRDDARFRGLYASMSLEKDALILGARTVLAKRDGEGGLSIEGERLLTLLAVAYGRPVDNAVLASIRRASKFARAGDECMASMRIALARLPQLPDPEDAARRLFIADGLIAGGVAPGQIWRALEFDPALLDELEKYSPSELRNPKGDGRISGRWTNGSEVALGEAESLSSRIASLAARISGRGTARTAGLAVPVVGELLAMTGMAGNWPSQGNVPGRPDLRYKWDRDENRLYVFRGADPYPVIQAVPYGSEFRDRRGRKVARLTETAIKFDLKLLPPEWPSPEELRDNPQQCPTQGPDLPGRPGNQGERDRDYADHVKAQ